MKLFKLGKIIEDMVTETKGMLTHATINMDHQVSYIYQPRGINSSTGQPVDRIYIENARVKGGIIEDVDVPLKIIGTHAEDAASGFAGIIVAIIVHLDGCIHVEVKPKGVLEGTGSTISSYEFDIRRLTGEALTVLNETELDESIKKTPSPSATISRTQR